MAAPDGTRPPTATLIPAPARTRPPVALGPSGTVVAVEVADDGAGATNVAVHAAQPGGPEVRTLTAHVIPPKGWHVGDTPVPRVTPDGWLALEVMDDTEQDIRTIVVDLAGGGSRVTGPLEGTDPVWLPDGSLVTTSQDEVHRYPGHGSGQPLDLRIEPPLSSADFVARDLSGVHVLRRRADDSFEPLTLGWDGTLTARDRSVPGYAGFGLARSYDGGAGGTASWTWCESNGAGAGGGCGRTWQRPDGSEVNVKLPGPLTVGAQAWTPDGRALVIAGGGAVALLRDARPVPAVTTLVQLGSLPKDAQVVGTTADAAVLEGPAGVYLVAFDGSGVRGPVPGFAATAFP